VISRDDAALAASDPALPGLATVLDDERIAAALRERLPSARIGNAARTYARYKPGRGCVVAYQLELGGSRLDVYARAHTRESFASCAHEPSDGRRAGTPLGSSVGLEEAAVVIRPFTSDCLIEALRDLWDEERRRELLAELLPDERSLWSAEVETLRYWPERRFTCCLRVGGEPRAVLKAYAEAPYSKAAGAVAAFRDCSAPRIPPLLARSDHRRILVFEWFPGERLDRAMAASRVDPRELERVGWALAELHLHPNGGLQDKDPRDRAAFLEKRAIWLAAVDEALAPRATRLGKRLAASIAAAPSQQRAIHGDFSPAQVLLTAAAPVIIDLDDAGRGDPARDLGSFAAQLERRAVDGEISPAQVEPFRDALLSGYEARGGAQVDPAQVRLWTAVELFARAPGAFRRRGTEWRRRVRALVTRADEVSCTV
jgi:aminoglycoside phosphotransferase (APT) family kinase protein